MVVISVNMVKELESLCVPIETPY